MSEVLFYAQPGLKLCEMVNQTPALIERTLLWETANKQMSELMVVISIMEKA